MHFFSLRCVLYRLQIMRDDEKRLPITNVH